MTQKVAIDLGNRFVKLSDQGRVWSVESIYADVQGCPEGPLARTIPQAVEYVKGSCEELVGKAWIAGHGARNYRRGIRTWTTEKHESALRLVLGSLELPRRAKTAVDRRSFQFELVMSLPNPQVEGIQLQKALVGEHHITDGGDPVKVIIESVKVKPEGIGAYRYGHKQGLTKPNSITGIIDLGGGTGIPD